MYKKMLAALIGFQSFVCAEGLSGFSVGGFLGTEARVTQNKSEDVGLTRYKVGHLFGLFGRYGRVINHNLYLGGELYSFGTTKNKTAKRGTNDIAYKRGVVTGITPIVGHVFSADSMAYAKLGLEVSKDKASFSDMQTSTKITYNPLTIATTTDNKYISASKTVYAFAPGFGFEHKFNNHFVAGVEYSYSIGQKIDVSKDFSVKRRSHQVMFRFAYKI